MSALSIQPAYPIFTGIDGLPLENGFVWIGTVNLDPQVNPINVYWDAALTIPAVQPIRTLAGYPSNSGTPARLYVNSDYSIRVLEKSGSVVYSSLAATERYSDAVISSLNADSVVYDPPFTNAVQTNAEAKLAQTVSVKDFGAVGDGITDDTAAIQIAIDYAIDNNKTLSLVDGTYSIFTRLNVTGKLTLEDGALITPNWSGNGSTTDWLLSVTGSDCVIQRVRIDGYKKVGFTIRVNANNVKILNCNISRAYRMGIVLVDSSNSLINGNTIYDIGNTAAPQVCNGIYLNASIRFGSKNNIITNNHITDVLWPSALGSLDADCIQIQGAVTGAIDNGNPNDARASIVNTIIANNYLARCSRRCVKIQDSYVNVSNNVMEDADQGVSLTGGTSIAFITIDGNTFNNCTFGHATGGTTVLNLVVTNNQYNNMLAEWFGEISGGIIQNALFDSNIIYVSDNPFRGRIISLGFTTRPSGVSKNITISNNQLYNVGNVVPSTSSDFNAFMVLNGLAQNIKFVNNLVQTKDVTYFPYLIRVRNRTRNIQIANNTYLLGTGWYPYVLSGDSSIMLKGETPNLKTIVRNNTIPSGSTTLNITHNLEVASPGTPNRIRFESITGGENARRALFQKFTVVPKNNPTNNVTYFVTPLTASEATVTLSGNPGASGFVFDLIVDLELDNEIIPASV